MNLALDIGLGALAISIAGLLYYAFSGRSPRSTPSSKATPEIRAYDTLSDTIVLASAASDDTDTKLTRSFYEYLLKQHQPNELPSNSLEQEFSKHWQTLLSDPALFPRQPMILPKLLKAMRAESNNSNALLQIILEDPGLTADVLKLANSPIYRNTEKEIESLDYALIMLGVDGLHALVCSSVMKPIFAKRKSEGFSSALYWEWSLACSQQAFNLSKQGSSSDAAITYMLTLFTRLSELIILRCCFRIANNTTMACSAENLFPIIERYRYQVTAKLIEEWGFDTTLIEQLPGPSTTRTNTKSLYAKVQTLSLEYASAAMLVKKKKLSTLEAQELLTSIGLPRDIYQTLGVSNAA